MSDTVDNTEMKAQLDAQDMATYVERKAATLAMAARTASAEELSSLMGELQYLGSLANGLAGSAASAAQSAVSGAMFVADMRQGQIESDKVVSEVSAYADQYNVRPIPMKDYEKKFYESIDPNKMYEVFKRDENGKLVKDENGNFVKEEISGAELRKSFLEVKSFTLTDSERANAPEPGKAKEELDQLRESLSDMEGFKNKRFENARDKIDEVEKVLDECEECKKDSFAGRIPRFMIDAKQEVLEKRLNNAKAQLGDTLQKEVIDDELTGVRSYTAGKSNDARITGGQDMAWQQDTYFSPAAAGGKSSGEIQRG